MDRDGVLAVLQHYFKEEVKTGWAFLVVALLALAAGAWLWRTQSAFRHALWPLAGLALLQLGMGGVLVLRSPARVAALQAQLDQAPAALKDQEGQRVARVLDAFRLYKLASIALILAALGLALFLPQNTLARGWALGLLLQCALLLAAGLVAEQRAETYLDALRRL
jgi:hypothetical protein